MKKSKVISTIIIFIALLFSMLSFSYVLDNYKNQNKNTVISIQNVASKGKSSSTFGEYEKVRALYEEMEDSAACGELSPQKVYSETVTPVLITKNYLDINNISYTGEGITDAMVKGKTATAIVSKTLAKKYFYGNRAIGKTFKIQNKRYRITGIYDDKNDFLNNLFKDGKERIYINCTSYEKYEKQYIHQMSCVSTSDAYQKFAGAALKNFQRITFEEKNQAVNDFTVVISLIITVVLAVYLIRLWIFILGNTGGFFKKKLENNYISRVLLHNIPSILLRALLILGIPTALFFLILLVTKDFHIVYNYIDKENLFSISSMIKKLGEVLGTEYATVYGGNSYPINLYNGTLIILAGITPVVVAMFFFFFHAFVNFGDNIKPRLVVTGLITLISLVTLTVCLVSDAGYALLQILLLINALMILKCINDFKKHPLPY